MKKRFITLLFLGVIESTPGQPLLGDSQHQGLHSALSKMGMSVRDLEFHKDIGEPDLLFDWSRNWLGNPLRFPSKVEQLTSGLKGQQPLWFEFIRDMMEAGPPCMELLEALPPVQQTKWPEGLSPELTVALDAFLLKAYHTSTLLKAAFEAVPETEQRYVALSFFAGALNAEDRVEIRNELLAFPASIEEVQLAIDEQNRVDVSSLLNRSQKAVQSIRRSCLVEAAQIWVPGLRRLQESVLAISEWPAQAVDVRTEWGRIIIGTAEKDYYQAPALLILDPSGDDVYQAPSGTANGLKGYPLGAILDLEGRDTFQSDILLGPGSALFGLSTILDRSGSDKYNMKFLGPAAGFFGAGWLEDLAGDDSYRSGALGQAAGYVGVGVLDDVSGNDVYEIGYSGQGYAGVLGFGLLVDRNGNDHYLAGGVRPDYERHDDRYLSLAQGFSIGSRPHAGGGFAALVDQEGNDSYVADVYGQGAGYWYAAGALVDEAGNDTYQLHQYGQGAGIHASLGLLADQRGNDRYTGYVLTQGCAHDYGVGFLLEREGEDTYTADHYSQGRGMYNALGVLIDSTGNDAYFSRQCDRSQGVGHDGGTREYGSLALLIDLAGKDQYSCGTDGESVQRPDFGIICDLESEEGE